MWRGGRGRCFMSLRCLRESGRYPERTFILEPTLVPPVLDPAKWEDFPAFRETFLMYFTEPPANWGSVRTALFAVGRRSSGPLAPPVWPIPIQD